MMSNAEKFSEMNLLAQRGGVVFFGSDYFAELPISELAASFGIDEKTYNRSLGGLCIADMLAMIDVCITQLKPSKVFVNIGDADIKKGNVDIEDFISKYEWLLYNIHTETNADIYVVSVLSDHSLAERINMRLRRLAGECGCKYIDITEVMDCKTPDLRMFSILKRYVRSRPLSFLDAMNIITAK